MTTVAKKKEKAKTKLDMLDELALKLPIFGENDYVGDTKVVSSGSIAMDLAIGIGGYPSGCILDVYGPESAGKSLISIMAMAQVQKAGGTVVVWDVERSYSKNTDWLKTNGVDTKKLRFLKLGPGQGCEIGMDAVEAIVKDGAADLVVVDSIPAMVPQSSLERAMTENDMVAARANALTRHLTRLVTLCDNSKTTVMFINQMRANLGGGMYEAKSKETSIWQMKHLASLRMAVTKLTGEKYLKMKNGVPYSHRVKVKFVKNKLGSPYRTAEFDIIYTMGVDHASEIADILLGAGVAKKSGSWYELDTFRAQGKDKLQDYIREPKNFEKYLKKAKSLADKINAFGVVDDGDQPEDDGTLTVGE